MDANELALLADHVRINEGMDEATANAALSAITSLRAQLAASEAREKALREGLWLFREFSLRNHTAWRQGANHHHPIYPMVAELVGEMGGITSGEYYRFIQPENRSPLTPGEHHG